MQARMRKARWARRDMGARSITAGMETKARFVWLHGFGSGPSSSKAAHAHARLAERGIPLEAPDLNQPSFFDLTVTRMLARLDAIYAERPAPLALIGSSLGG